MEEVKKKKGERGGWMPHVSHWTDRKSSCKLKLFLKVIPDKKTTSFVFVCIYLKPSF